jgi:effector-binding domain-containing protein
VQLSRWISAAFRELFECVGEQAAGPPFAISPAPDEEETVAARAALPVVGDVVPRGRVMLRHESRFRALVALQRGPYEKLPEVHRALWNAIHDQGVEPAGEPREIYLSDPAEVGDPAHYLTEVVWPIAFDADWRPHEGLFTKPLSTTVDANREATR